MEFSIPIKYLYAENQIVDSGLMEAICKDFAYGWDTFPEHIRDEEEFLSVLERILPEGAQSIADGILNVDIYDNYDYYFSEVPSYCERHGIPIDLIEEPEFVIEQTIFTFIRPNRETKKVPVDEKGTVLTPLEEIMDMINEADEEVSDTEIMIGISNYLENKNPYSDINSIKNWV